MSNIQAAKVEHDARMTVLVVDDDRSTVDVLCRFLTKEQFDAIGALGGHEALEVAARRSIDIVLLDLTMPGMDGFTVCRELKRSSKTRDIPVIVLTARDDPSSRAHGIHLGISDYIVKPTTPAEIINRVRMQSQAVRKQREADAMIATLHNNRRKKA